MALEGPERWARVRTRHVRDVVARLLNPARRVTGWSLPAQPQAKSPPVSTVSAKKGRGR
jgi:hypothetical protein